MAQIWISLVCSECGWTCYLEDDGIITHGHNPVTPNCSNNNKEFRLNVKDPQEGEYSKEEMADRFRSMKVEKIGE